ncbi:arginine utilization regulatory protein [Scopulibacillus darangshiensis]|uniref:Arginine utilization regulatory protein n=1 Tax=Scopulibacillus darangshiensis TaxID=442528 RepID=A0A4R2NI39_9BACL|nr:sigma 54-interacting transcriptional regulator [Scopulibacillus darangshiensis]TCP21067.1 arginine utilization regulatory protein [Scopulibacillus darangshiensis]
MMAAAIGSILIDFAGGVVIFDEDKRVTWVGGKIDDSFSPKNGQSFANVFGLEERDMPHNKKTIVTASGKIFLLRKKSFTLPDIRLTIIMLDDLTDVVSNKEARLACLEKIVDTLNDGIVMSDHEGKIALYNKAEEKLENLEASKVKGQYLWDAYNYGKPALSEHRQVFQSQKPVIGDYQAHAHINGIPQYVRYSTYPIIRHGKTIAVFSVSTNDTKLKKLLHETLELKRKMLTLDEENKMEHSNGTNYTFDNIKGNSKVLKNLIKEAQNVAVHNTDVLIVGETGTGKELFAQSIHNHSEKIKHPFVAVNCAAIPESLLESTLFGTVKGAYTGAVNQKGLFEYAQAGTLFLDEINSMPMSLQSKLMRVLEEKKIRRLGTNEITPVHCTIISASNEDPQELMTFNKMRSDLYYRIARITIAIPPLRERKDDITSLINVFIHRYNLSFNKDIQGISDQLNHVFLHYSWPGNIRELEHVIENLMINAEENDHLLDISHLPSYLRSTFINDDKQNLKKKRGRRPLKTAVASAEEEYIRDALEKAGWNITKAAKNLGTTRQNIQYHMKKFDLKKP